MNNAASPPNEINPSPWAFQQTFLCFKEREREEICEKEIQKQLLSCRWWIFSQLLSWADEDPRNFTGTNFTAHFGAIQLNSQSQEFYQLLNCVLTYFQGT